MKLQKSIITAFIIVAAFTAGTYVINLPIFASLKETAAFATTVKPETFTELYFEDHLNLPKSTEKEIAQKLTFTIHNLEYKTMNYPYEVTIEDTENNKATLAQEKVTLKHDEKKSITLYYKLLLDVKRAKVTVNLPQKNQSIHFWIGEENK